MSARGSHAEHMFSGPPPKADLAVALDDPYEDEANRLWGRSSSGADCLCERFEPIDYVAQTTDQLGPPLGADFCDPRAHVGHARRDRIGRRFAFV